MVFANVKTAYLSSSRLEGADLTSADLTQAILKGTNLGEAIVGSTSFRLTKNVPQARQ
jgi:uncharacterized protein YjbI with pentapeptide repeats